VSDFVTVIEQPGNTFVTVIHEGVKGNDGDQGIPGEVTGPNASDDGEVVVFDGTTGKIIKRSNVLLAALALAADLADKVDVVAGYGLSQEDFTTVLKDKLDALAEGGFVGTYVNAVALEAAFPTATDGSYAFVTDTGLTQVLAVWDETNTVWVYLDLDDKVDKVTGYGLSQNDFTNAYKALVDGAVQTTTFDAVVAAFEAAIAAIANNVVTEATVARTLTTADGGRYIRLTNAAGCTITLNTDAVALWTGNPEIQFRITQATLPTLSIAGGVTVNNSAALAGLAQHDNFALKRVGADQWDLILR
jgi:hypothetical protein